MEGRSGGHPTAMPAYIVQPDYPGATPVYEVPAGTHPNAMPLYEVPVGISPTARSVYMVRRGTHPDAWPVYWVSEGDTGPRPYQDFEAPRVPDHRTIFD